MIDADSIFPPDGPDLDEGEPTLSTHDSLDSRVEQAAPGEVEDDDADTADSIKENDDN